MKTTYTAQQVENILAQTEVGLIDGTCERLTEGHSSQVFSFQTNIGERLVIRVRESQKDLEADYHAFKSFSNILPIPNVIWIGAFDETCFCIITPFVTGEPLNRLTSESFENVLPGVQSIIASTFQIDISSTVGYGAPDFTTGNAHFFSWKEFLKTELEELGVDRLEASANRIALPNGVVGKLVAQFTENLPYVSEERRLLHGDPGNDNIIVNEGKVSAVLDWEQMAYGDWMRDFSRFEFWGSNYGDTSTFAQEYTLDAENLRERKATYWALHALRNIEFADRDKNKYVADWMRANITRIIL